MVDLSPQPPLRWPWKAILAVVVILPFLPEVVIIATSLVAGLSGCQAAGNTACEFKSAGDVIRHALETGISVGHRFSEGFAAVWLIVCCILVTRGWTRLSSRLLLVLVLSVICAFAPYFGPMLSIDHLKNVNCGVDKSGLPCKIYGSNLTDAAYNAVDLGEKIFEGARIVLAVFVG
jgi:hypothetical protein